MVFSLISFETSPGILFPGSKGVAKTGTDQIDFSVFSFHLVEVIERRAISNDNNYFRD